MLARVEPVVVAPPLRRELDRRGDDGLRPGGDQFQTAPAGSLFVGTLRCCPAGRLRRAISLRSVRSARFRSLLRLCGIGGVRSRHLLAWCTDTPASDSGHGEKVAAHATSVIRHSARVSHGLALRSVSRRSRLHLTRAPRKAPSAAFGLPCNRTERLAVVDQQVVRRVWESGWES